MNFFIFQKLYRFFFYVFKFCMQIVKNDYHIFFIFNEFIDYSGTFFSHCWSFFLQILKKKRNDFFHYKWIYWFFRNHINFLNFFPVFEHFFLNFWKMNVKNLLMQIFEK